MAHASMLPITAAHLVGDLALLATGLMALHCGQRGERVGFCIILVAWIVSALVERRSSWIEPQYALFAVDVVTLGLLIWVHRTYGRLWPLVAAAFQVISVLSHPLFWINMPALARAFYYANFSIGFLLLGAIWGGCVIEKTAT